MTDGLMSSDDPVSRVVVSSAPGATEADVRRVLDCLSARMSGGTIEVAQVSDAEDGTISG
jgi:hypothetical protein